MLEVWDEIETEVESEVSECEDDLVVQECVGNSTEEEVTLESSTAGPSSACPRTGYSRGNPVVYDWKEIRNSKEREALQLECMF